MSQYPKWFLALNFPNIIIPVFITMICLMFGGIHPFGNVDSWFWSFIIYIFTQIFWVFPIVLFFISTLAWGGMREKIAIGTALAGWVFNIIALCFIYL